MIGKICKHRKDGQSSVRDLVSYITSSDKTAYRTDQKVAVWFRNMAADTPAEAIDEMRYIAESNSRARRPLMHMVVSWPQDETPNNDLVVETAETILRDMGLDDNQAVFSLHKDTENFHMHIAVNRIRADDLQIITPAKGWTKNAIQASCRKMELKHGLTIQHGGSVDVINGRIVKVKNKRAAVNASARDFENYTGKSSEERRLKEVCQNIFSQADSWEGLKKNLSCHGIELRKKGSGGVLLVNSVEVKLSRIHRNYTWKKLTEKFGLYQLDDSVGRDNLQADGAQTVPLKNLAPEAPAPKPIVEMSAWDNYAAEKEAYYGLNQLRSADRKDKKEKLEDQHDREWTILKTKHESERQILNGTPMPGKEKNQCRQQLKITQMQERLSLQIKHATEKEDFYLRWGARPNKKFPPFKQWLKENGTDEDLNKWRFKRQNKIIKPADGETSATEPVQSDYTNSLTTKKKSLEHLTSWLENGAVYYRYQSDEDPQSQSLVFIDYGQQIGLFSETEQAILAGLQIGLARWGRIVVDGDRQFQFKCFQIALDNGLILGNPEFQEMLEERKNIKQANEDISPKIDAAMNDEGDRPWVGNDDPFEDMPGIGADDYLPGSGDGWAVEAASQEPAEKNSLSRPWEEETENNGAGQAHGTSAARPIAVSETDSDPSRGGAPFDEMPEVSAEDYQAEPAGGQASGDAAGPTEKRNLSGAWAEETENDQGELGTEMLLARSIAVSETDSDPSWSDDPFDEMPPAESAHESDSARPTWDDYKGAQNAYYAERRKYTADERSERYLIENRHKKERNDLKSAYKAVMQRHNATPMNAVEKNSTGRGLILEHIKQKLALKISQLSEIDAHNRRWPELPPSVFPQFKEWQEAFQSEKDDIPESLNCIVAAEPGTENQNEGLKRLIFEKQAFDGLQSYSSGRYVYYSYVSEDGRDAEKIQTAANPAFIDCGERIAVLSSENEQAVLASLRLSVAKWGAITIEGDDNFINLCSQLAVCHDIKIKIKENNEIGLEGGGRLSENHQNESMPENQPADVLPERPEKTNPDFISDDENEAVTVDSSEAACPYTAFETKDGRDPFDDRPDVDIEDYHAGPGDAQAIGLSPGQTDKISLNTISEQESEKEQSGPMSAGPSDLSDDAGAGEWDPLEDIATAWDIPAQAIEVELAKRTADEPMFLAAKAEFSVELDNYAAFRASVRHDLLSRHREQYAELISNQKKNRENLEKTPMPGREKNLARSVLAHTHNLERAGFRNKQATEEVQFQQTWPDPSHILFPSFETWQRGFDPPKLMPDEYMKVRETMTDKTLLENLETYHQAVQADRYRVTAIRLDDNGGKKTFILDKDRKTGKTEGFTPDELFGQIKQLERLVKRGENLYLTPMSQSTHHILIDDLSGDNLQHLRDNGFKPCAVIGSSINNYQAIVNVPKIISGQEKNVANKMAQVFNERYGDKNLSGAIHPHRMPGTKNFKEKHRFPDGTFPDVVLMAATPGICEKSFALSQELDKVFVDYAGKEDERRQEFRKRVQNDVLPAKASPQAAYLAHANDLINYYGGGVDQSRVDFMAATRMRVTGYSMAEIASGITIAGPEVRTPEDVKKHTSWDDYANRTAQSAFSAKGDQVVERWGHYRNCWLKTEGRQCDSAESQTEESRYPVKKIGFK